MTRVLIVHADPAATIAMLQTAGFDVVVAGELDLSTVRDGPGGVRGYVCGTARPTVLVATERAA